ncbi:MAG: hypothetical protein CVU42_11900 [Chloroflexi bacterium HGW-Chloroflexi-4]|jgi:hypothetical protein|nr:MAG: hypothetical protein CVU42_11900 [Chloroflexi bacterium HGW-Chloroflexi-4]
MIFTGLLSIIQILFLPGLIINSFIKKEAGFLYRVSYIIAFSMVINLVYIVLLVSFKAYTFIAICIIVFVEIALIFYLYFKSITQPIGKIGSAIHNRINNVLINYLGSRTQKSNSEKVLKAIKILALLLALLTVVWVVFDFVNQIGSVFGYWDSVISYNRWATEWASGVFPTGACEYPQLLPANWSLTYLLTQSQVTIFAKLIQGVFPILFVLAILDLGLTYGSAGLLFGVPLSVILLKKFAGISIFEGYMDVAVTTFTLLSFYIILKDIRRNSYSSRTLWLSSIVILAAALTKQPGALSFCAWVFINLFLQLSKNHFKLWPSIKKMALPTLVILSLIASWYLFKMNRDLFIGERSCLAITNSWTINYLNSGFWNILLYRFKLLDIWVCFIPIMIIAVFIAKDGFKLLLLCFGIPYLIVSLFYGLPAAFVRYLTPLAFIFAFSVSILIDQIIQILRYLLSYIHIDRCKACFSNIYKKISSIGNNVSQLTFWWVLILGILVIVLIGLKYPDSKLIRNYQIQQMGIGNRSYNEILVDFYSDKDPNDLTISWYPYVNYLPGLEDRAIFIDISNLATIRDFLSLDNIRYVLRYNSTPRAIVEYLNGLEKQGKLLFITDFGVKNDAVLYEVVR